MKKIIILLFGLLLLCVASCDAKQKQKVSLTNSSVKTITATLDGKKYFNQKGYLTFMAGVKYHDLYFCWFKGQVDYEIYDRIFAFSKEGKLLQEISLPEKFYKYSYYDQMFVRNDSLLIKSYYFDKPDYQICLKDSAWVMVKTNNELSRLIYEDADFRVYFKDMGEWGEYLHFAEQKTNVIHTYLSNAVRIIRHDDGYYLYNYYSVSRIPNPHEGKTNNNSVLDVLEGNIPHSYSESIIQFKNTSDNPLLSEYDSTIVAVTYVNRKTKAIIYSKKEAFVAEINGKNIKRLYSLGSPFGEICDPEDFGKNTSDNYSSSYFSRNRNHYGIVELEGDSVTFFKINISYPKKKKR